MGFEILKFVNGKYERNVLVQFFMDYPKVLFDMTGLQPHGGSKRHGGAKYGETVFCHILERHLPICCCYNSQEWLRPEIENLVRQNHITMYDLQKNTLEDIVNAEKIDRIYTPLATLNHIHFKKCQVIGTIHDVRSLEKPLDIGQIEYKPWNNIYRFLLKVIFNQLYRKKKSHYYEEAFSSENFKFVTVSNHSAYALKSYFPQYKDRFIPVYYSPSVTYKKVMTRKYTEKYFLLVSAERFDKNVLRAIKALDRLFANSVAQDFRVKVTGILSPKVFWYKLKEPDRFDFVGFVDENDLAQLYHDAYCFIYPSLSEGFGYPPLEAMHFGVPVLASPFTAIPEICGSGVIYFNPLSVEEIMNRIQLILCSDIHQKYSVLGKERESMIAEKQQKDLDGLIDYIFNIKMLW